MKRREALQTGSISRGRGRRRTAPLQPFDPVPPELVEAAKRLFSERGSAAQPSIQQVAHPGTSDREPDGPYRFQRRIPGPASPWRGWKLSW